MCLEIMVLSLVSPKAPNIQEKLSYNNGEHKYLNDIRVNELGKKTSAAKIRGKSSYTVSTNPAMIFVGKTEFIN